MAASPPRGLNVRQRTPVSARARQAELPPQLVKYVQTGETLVAEPFKGITLDGSPVPDLFPVQKTGVSTAPITDAARAFLASLSDGQRARALFALESDAWRRWSNIHPFLMRHGVCLDEMSPTQRDSALGLIRESLSTQGFQTARDVMRLNELVLAITGSRAEYGEWLYWMSILGTPSADGPWGWQIDGHHLIVNCFILGDQIVMTPMFMGSEPVAADEGPYTGTRVFQDEEQQGLALMRALTAEQRERAIIAAELRGEVFTAAFRDNLQMKYQGVASRDLATAQQRMLLEVLETYVGRIRPGHAAVWLDEVKRHLGETHFAWMGGTDEDGVLYYRVYRPVLL